jgi:hypothetical protein
MQRREDLLCHEKEVRRRINECQPVRDILNWLRSKGARVTHRDIYNFGQQMRTESLNGLTPIQWLDCELDKLGYYKRIEFVEGTRKVKTLLYVHPGVLQIWRQNPDVLLLDCKSIKDIRKLLFFH